MLYFGQFLFLKIRNHHNFYRRRLIFYLKFKLINPGFQE